MSNSDDGIIFNIQGYCIHDGPGIRTSVFLKGCPLRCLWCQNPESHSFYPELLFVEEKCAGCGRCVQVCPEKAIRMHGKASQTDRRPLQKHRIVCRCLSQRSQSCNRAAGNSRRNFQRDSCGFIVLSRVGRWSYSERRRTSRATGVRIQHFKKMPGCRISYGAGYLRVCKLDTGKRSLAPCKSCSFRFQAHESGNAQEIYRGIE